jgi:Tol biopolymer transport system component/DNA-binding winged helix-turn-helix (wHTH) protein
METGDGARRGVAVYVFGDVRVDVRRFQVARAGRPLTLEPKAFDLLTLLLESHGEVVTKAEIFERLWPSTAVTDNALTRIVAQLRKALGDDAREAKYIETVPTRGYRWLADVRSDFRPSSVPRPRRAAVMAAVFVVTLVATLVAVAALARRNPPGGITLSAVTLQPVQLTASTGLDAFPTFSPDGRFIAYASNRSGPFEITVRGLAGGAEDRTITSDNQQNVQPAWSPDGELIAYHSRRRGGIWIVPALGGVSRQISRFGSKPAWSPDGKRIAFQSDPCVDISPTSFSANIPSSIWVADRDGLNARALTRPANPIGAHGAPSWSPDGRHIAFITSAAGPLQLWTVPSEGGDPARIPGMHGVYDPVFAPDGHAIYAATGGPALKMVPVSAESGLATGDVEEIVTPGIESARHLSLSPDGHRIALAAMDFASQIWTTSMKGDAIGGTPAPIVAERTRRQSEPAFSPDGASLAFLSSRRGAGWEIWIVDAGGGRPVPVTLNELFTPAWYGRPAWMPGGREISFISGGKEVVRALKIDLDVRRETAILEVPPANGPDGTAFPVPDLVMSPDGSSAAYSQIDPATGRPRLYVRRLSDPAAHAATSGESSERFPVWSPDSRSIAFEVKKDDSTHIALVAATGGAPRLVTSEPSESWPYGWSPDGDRILFAALREGVWNVWWVSTTSGIVQQVTQYVSANTFVRYPLWSPKGDRIAYELGTVTGNIWIGRFLDPSR